MVCQLTTRDLRLRQMCLDDCEKIFLLTKEPSVAKYMHFSKHENLTQTQQMVSDYLEKQKLHLALPYVIEEQMDGKFVGVFILKRGTIEEKGYSITVFLAPESWGKGYLSQLLLGVQEFVFDTLKMEYLEAYVVQENIGSCKGCLKAGFFLYQQLTFDDWDGVLNVYRINRDGEVVKTKKIHKHD